MKKNRVSINRVVEFGFKAKMPVRNPFFDVDFFAEFVTPSGKRIIVPGFWDGGNEWKIRYSSDEPGIHEFETKSIPSIEGISEQKGYCEVKKDKGEKNPLYKFGGPTVVDGKIVYKNGKEFFWLGDTWWMGLCSRLDRNGFKIITKDRIEKGFTVVQIVAGLYPDMDWYDPRGKNEGGYPYKKDFSEINPAYFKYADWKIGYLADSGIAPCIVGAWGYYLKLTGIETMKKHWRNLVARYAAYPVIWCLAGETIMPYYLSETRDEDLLFQKSGWTEVARYLKQCDPFNRPLTAHPTNLGHEQIEQPQLLDINMLQTGHGSHQSIENICLSIEKARHAFPEKPIVNGEVNYEGIGESCRQEIQRMSFWASFLSGAKGFTYGANGIWQVNVKNKPYGPSPHGRSWGDTPSWDVAYKLQGSYDVSTGKKILSEFQWQNIVPCPEKIISKDKFSFAGEIPDTLLLIYVSPPCFSNGIEGLSHLKSNCKYQWYWVDPKDGRKRKGFVFQTDADGTWKTQKHFWGIVPVWQDWLIQIKEEK